MIQLIGDLSHDTYYKVDCSRINPEAPTLIMEHIGEECTTHGMAGNVLANLDGLYNTLNEQIKNITY